MHLILFIGFVLAFIACVLHVKSAYKWSFIVLCSSAFFLRLYMAHLDPFLHDWDERFHALVARNFMDDPFFPVLKKGIPIPYDYKLWCCNEIWLHKQPLFMWQMAASMKIFGVSEFTIRYPSVLMGALMICMVYRIAQLTTGSRNIAFGSALLLCFCNYHLELISGYHGMDHNDVAFGFYVLASIWAYSEYLHSTKKMKWALLIGLFSACAILNKWLTGLLVYSAWSINILFAIRNKEVKKEIVDFLSSIAVCVLVFLPWQLYIHYRFPLEASHEMKYNARHISEAVEGHGGDNYFYWDHLAEYFGGYIWVLVPVGFVFMVLIRSYKLRHKVLICIPIAVVYCFFSFIVQTKITSYFFVVAPLCYVLIAVAVRWLITIATPPAYAYISIVAVVCYFTFDHQLLKQRRRHRDEWRNAIIYNTDVYKDLHNHLPDSIKVVSNLGEMEDIKCMFYNKGILAHHYDFTREEMEIIQKKDIPIAVFMNHHIKVPTYILSYPKTYIIWIPLK